MEAKAKLKVLMVHISKVMTEASIGSLLLLTLSGNLRAKPHMVVDFDPSVQTCSTTARPIVSTLLRVSTVATAAATSIHVRLTGMPRGSVRSTGASAHATFEWLLLAAAGV